MNVFEKINANIRKSKYKNVTTKNQLPDSRGLLFELRDSFEAKNDLRRAFLCADKAKDLGSKNADQYLAWHYWNGYGTEKNIELARKHQLAYYLNEFRSNEKLFRSSIYLWWNEGAFEQNSKAKPFVDCAAMKEVARDFIARSDPRGIFLLEDAILADVSGIKLGASPKEQKAVWLSIKENPHAKYHIAGSRSKAMYEAAEGGSYFAWDDLEFSSRLFQWDDSKNDKYYKEHDGARKMKRLLEEAVEIMQKGYDYAEALFTERAKQVLVSYALLEEGERAVQAGDDSGWEKIHTAASMGNPRAEIRSYQKLAQAGQAEAQRKLAELCLVGRDDLKQDVEQALSLFRQSADHANAASQYRLAHILEEGLYGVSRNMEQALPLYTAAASQGNRNACFRMSKWHSMHGDFNTAKAYLEPFLQTKAETKEAHRETLFAFLQLYRGYGCKNEVYPHLEFALAYAYEIACEALRNSDDPKIRRALHSFDTMKTTLEAVRDLANAYDTVFKNSLKENDLVSSAEQEAVYETFMLWQIKLKEARAQQGDLDAMIGLYSDYKSVGGYTTQKSSYTQSGYSVYFTGNRDKSIYWVEQAISRGDATAMEIKGEDWKFFGISQQEGEQWLKKAAASGGRTAAQTLQVNREIKAKEAAFERDVREYQRRQADEAAKKNAANELEKKGVDAVFSVHMLPQIITGPYQLTYKRVKTDAFSAEYQGERGDFIVIRNEEIGATGRSAKTAEGYFYW